MMFSILLPTRNRLDLLRLAIESVRLQKYDDWEIVVADNCSEQDVPAYVASIGDARIRCHHSSRPIPVTENWNAALERSSGDYVIMLGDDDALMPGCLVEARRLIDEFARPQAIYAQALQFAYPGVVPGHARGFIQTGYNAFLKDAREPFRLPRAVALQMVRDALGFRMRYGFNMQHFIVGRQLVDALRGKGPFFQSPYPDYYAANAILLAAESLVATPRPLAMIGISPKSFGYYYVNKREGDGVAFLQGAVQEPLRKRLAHTLVPGSDMNDSWLSAMEALVENFGEQPGLRVDYARYRVLQYHALLRAEGLRGVPAVLKFARLWEWFAYGPALLLYLASYVLPRALRERVRGPIRRRFGAYPSFDPGRTEGPWRDILEAVRGQAG